MKKFIPLSFLLLLIYGCNTSGSSEATDDTDSSEIDSEFVEFNNPAAEGFNQEDSDLLATLLADKVMMAMGGREAWDKTNVIKWNFFGRRTLTWNKATGDVRIEIPAQNLTILENINTKEGKVQKNGVVLSDSVDFYLNMGYQYWINDSYWLVMPFKLKDSGVTLKYLGEDSTLAGKPADVVSLSFENVGVTPQNIYEVWIDTDSKLISQWSYYPDSSLIEPMFTTPWNDYKTYGDILLSGDRGSYQLTDIEVFESVADSVFQKF